MFLEMMKVLYPEQVGFSDETFKRGASAKQIRARKGELLSKFREDGYFLIDAYAEPMPDNASLSTKASLMRDTLPAVRRRLSHLPARKETPIILIGGVTYAVCDVPLRSDAWNVVNTPMIDHPSQGGQVRLRSKLRGTLKALRGKAAEAGQFRAAFSPPATRRSDSIQPR